MLRSIRQQMADRVFLAEIRRKITETLHLTFGKIFFRQSYVRTCKSMEPEVCTLKYELFIAKNCNLLKRSRLIINTKRKSNINIIQKVSRS